MLSEKYTYFKERKIFIEISRLFVVIVDFYLRRQVVFPFSLVLHFYLHLRRTYTAKKYMLRNKRP
jgi:hypothetical protein